ncbi:hypothetical protein CFN16_01740 [Pseudomonas fluorescens]|uniref:DUF4123 domain-containing protein n=1 Tax=Pseudomonas fluorescens TaxID=294 RepID=A0A345UQZ5_PSEFL|nr:DUF4123 domain-containing protein [Pseudomonas fluorescens]AXJ02897.1 hypothetical protein CFN16_01740 [Pseudomonas fluorescens]WJK10434.1 DUF4123 domain-containing protein [Pseudomonas fluorescens]
MRRSAKSASAARRVSVQPDQWLKDVPLKPSEQLFAIFSSTSAVDPLKAWLSNAQMPIPVWAETIYAEWDALMPYVGIIDAGSEFLDWVATTESRDWGWLAVSSAGLEAVVEHFRSLTQVLMPDGKAVFFRFWDGRYLLPILESPEVDAGQLLPVLTRGLINGQAVEIGGRARVSGREFPWWSVPEKLLSQFGDETRINNALQWLSEEQPALFEAFPTDVLRCKVVRFFAVSASDESSASALLDYLRDESE